MPTATCPPGAREWLLRAAAPVQRFTRWLEVCRRIDDPDYVATFLAMERWGADAVPFPGEVYRQYIRTAISTTCSAKVACRSGARRSICAASPVRS